MSNPLRIVQQELQQVQQSYEILEAQTRQLEQQLELVAQLLNAPTVDEASSPGEALNDLLAQTCQAIGARDGSISRLLPDSDELEFVLVQGQLSEQLLGYRLPSNTGIAGWVVEHSEPIIVNTPQQDWRFSQLVDNEFSFMTGSIASVPIIRQQQLLGLIQLLNKTDNTFIPANLGLMLTLARVAAPLLANIEVTPPASADAFSLEPPPF